MYLLHFYKKILVVYFVQKTTPFSQYGPTLMGHLRTVLNLLKVYTYDSVSFGIFAGETSPNFQNEIMPLKLNDILSLDA